MKTFCVYNERTSEIKVIFSGTIAACLTELNKFWECGELNNMKYCQFWDEALPILLKITDRTTRYHLNSTQLVSGGIQ